MVYTDETGDPLRFRFLIDQHPYDLEFDIESEMEIAPRHVETRYRLTLVGDNGKTFGQRSDTLSTTAAAHPFFDVASWRTWDEWHEFVVAWLAEIDSELVGSA